MIGLEEFSIITVSLSVLNGLFGVPASYVLGFLFKLVLLFLASAVISKLMHLENNYHERKKYK